jgi:3-isopropylmalate/(R)-2-methylmalate dehydratase small subunit
MEKLITGKAFYCGDFVDTDVMSPGRYEPFGSNEELARIALIDYESDPPFVNPETGKSPFTVIFAGHEFGCGSSRETAPLALAGAGAKIVIARSFARIFFRNCINLGVLLPIIYDHPFDETIIGQEVTVNTAERFFKVGDKQYEFGDFGPLTAIIEAGGLTNYNKQRIATGELK